MTTHLRPASGIPSQITTSRSNAAPQSSRAMAPVRTVSLEVMLSQLRQYESTKLYPRLALFEALATFKDKPRPRQHSDDTVCVVRRDFLDSFAYLCDTTKGGSTVTATALRSLPGGDVLWLAANEGVSDEVFRYADSLIEQLKTVTAENATTMQDSILAQAMAMCRDRVKFYKDKIQPLSTKCRMQLRYKERDEIVKLLRRKLSTLSEPGPSLTKAGYVDVCFNMRDADIGHIKRFSSNPEDDFAQLAHYIWRLGATRSAANTVVQSMRTVLSLHRIKQLRRVSIPLVTSKILDPTCISPYEILQGIASDSATRQPQELQNAFARLLELDTPVDRPLFNKISARTEIATRVHAELQIVDTFSRDGYHFVANDKYIGCSKPACYFCYNWLIEHHHIYVAPATHYKIIPGCRGPDNSLNESGAQKMLQMYGKIGNKIGQDVLEFLGQNRAPRMQYMSTQAPSTAVSSSGAG